MPRPVTDILNLGPSSAEAFARAGITSAEEVEAIGADAAYLRLLQSGARPHFIGYYVLVMGLQGRPWNDCRDTEKKSLRKRFDALKAQAKRTPSEAKDRARLDAVFDEIGLIARR
jgi:DNA transformation protein and related proteins